MDSDDSYESTSEDVHESDLAVSTSTSQESVNRNSTVLRELYTSTFSRPTFDELRKSEQSALLSLQVKELNNHVDALKQERIGLLEQVTTLCSSLEKKEEELVDFMHYYEQKANDVAEYMQKVQTLLSQLNALFYGQGHTSGQSQSDLPPWSKSRLGLSSAAASAENPPDSSNADEHWKADWSEQTRTLLQALSVSVETASARNKQATQSRSSTLEATRFSKSPTLQTQLHSYASRYTSCAPADPVASSLVRSQQTLGVSSPLVTDSPPAGEGGGSSQEDPAEATVGRLPPFCWTVDHVVYWLTVHACLPGGCIESAKRHQIDGKQLTSLAGSKLEKLLCLNDAGLRRKLHLALEDLRVHGPPGTSRCPGPSHIRPHWVCNVWLRRHIGLSQLAPVFAIRRVDGRLLASLAIYKSSAGVNGAPLIIHHVAGHDPPSHPSVSLTSNSATATSDSISINGITNPLEASGAWSGASHKKLRRILLGIGRDTVSSTGGDACSGADLPTETKYILGKREACSLRCGIELLRRFNFNVELLEETQRKSEQSEASNLLLWSNEKVASWLISLGLKDFVEGIEGTGLHGAYMVLDATFDSTRLVKHLRIPSTIAVAHELDARLQALLIPARIREGITTKQRGIFRIRSTSRHAVAKRTSSSVFPEIRLNIKLGSSVINTNSDATSLTRIKSERNEKPLAPIRLDDSLSNDGSSSSARLPQNSPIEKQVSATRSRQDDHNADSAPQMTNNNNNNNNNGHNNYLAKVFSRGRSVFQGPATGRQQGEDPPEAPSQPSPQAEEDGDGGGDWGTLVRKSSASSTQLSGHQVKKTSSGASPHPKASPAAVLLHPCQSTRTTPVRGVVKACEAPIVDPFNREQGRGRMRIFFGPTARTNISSPNNVSSSLQSFSPPPPPLSPTRHQTGSGGSVEESISTCSATCWLSNDCHRRHDSRRPVMLADKARISSDLAESLTGLSSLV